MSSPTHWKNWRTEAGMRAGIAALPDGEYHEEMEMEIEGIAEPQTLAVTVRIEGSVLRPV